MGLPPTHDGRNVLDKREVQMKNNYNQRTKNDMAGYFQPAIYSQITNI